MTPVISLPRGPGRRPGAVSERPGPLDVRAVRGHFTFPELGRIVTNNAASTQPPRELVALYQSLAPGYENVHRGQSSASQQMTALFEGSYDTIAQFIGAPGRASIALYRNTTEVINAVMYALLTEFRDGDNVVTTMMEHNSNYVPWHAMCREILPRLGRRVECRLGRFDPGTGELDLDHLESLVDVRTKLVCCAGAAASCPGVAASDKARTAVQTMISPSLRPVFQAGHQLRYQLAGIRPAQRPSTFPGPANCSRIRAQNAGRSSGQRLEVMFWSVTTSRSTALPPALRMSVLTLG
jgi:Aminotransferase class-V